MAAAKKQMKVTQIKSSAGRFDNQHATLIGLGLGKIRRSRVVEDTPSTRGMVRTVQHLIEVEQV